MSNQQILEKAIQKAIAGGFKAEFASMREVTIYNLKMGITYKEIMTIPLEYVIFHHDFAKALWGAEDAFIYSEYTSENLDKYGLDGATIELKMWEYHLQQMVVAADPIKYLGEHLDV